MLVKYEINPVRVVSKNKSVLDLFPVFYFFAGQMLTSSYQNVQGRVTAGFCNCRVSILSNEDRDTLQTLHLQDFWALSTSFHLFPDTWFTYANGIPRCFRLYTWRTKLHEGRAISSNSIWSLMCSLVEETYLASSFQKVGHLSGQVCARGFHRRELCAKVFTH